MRCWIWLFATLEVFAQVRVIPHVTDRAGPFETEVILVNTNEGPAAYRLTAHDADGKKIGIAQAVLAGGRTFSREAAAFFESDRASHFTVDGDAGLRVLVSYRARNGGSPAETREQEKQALRWQFFPGDWERVHDGFAVVNLGDAPARVMLRRIGAAGKMTAERVLFPELAINAKATHLMADELPVPEKGAVFQVEADQPLAFLALRFGRDGADIMWQNPAIPMPPSPEPASNGVRSFKVLFTNDEHGWMEATDTHGGAAGMAGLWKANEGPGQDLLILSGGDMWTGPAISTWTKGESMAEVLNAMDYDAAAIGNHEFDFGLDVLRERAKASGFPFLSANLREKDSGRRVELALPFTIVEVGEVNVGVIGLTTTATPQITFPSVTGGLDFPAYEEALRETAPLARAHGAEVLIVTAHVCTENLRTLAPLASELGISLLAGGHCNQRLVESLQGVTLVEAGSFLRDYARVVFSVDGGRATVTGAALVENKGGVPDAVVQAEIDYWKGQVDDELNQVIGYIGRDLERFSPEIANMVTDAWLWAFPESEISISVAGGIRQGLFKGEITRGDIAGILPFENLLMQVKITGQQVVDNIECCNPILAGMSASGGYRLRTGGPLDLTRTYSTMITDFIYQGGGGFLFAEQDPKPIEIGLNWREPVIDWIRSLNTDADNPLDAHLDPVPRR